MKIQRLLSSKVTKNAGWIIAGRVYHMMLAFLVGLITARYLGPANYGLINYATSITAFFTSFCTLGINSVIVKNFIDYPEEQGTTIGSTIVLRTLSSLFSIIIIMSITFIADRGERTTHIVVAFCSIGVLFQVMDTLKYWFQSRLESKYSAFATVISYTVVSIYKIWLLFTQKDVVWFAISTSLDYLVIAIVLVIIYKKRGGPRFSFSAQKGKQLLSSSYHFILTGLMVAVYGSTDKFMLKQMLSEIEVGYYSTALSLCNTWVFVLAAIIDSMFPVILQSYGKDHAVFERKNKQLYAMIFYISICVSAGISLLALPVVRILYGESYIPAAAPLRIITWYTAFSYLGVARDAWIISNKKQRFLKYIYVASAVANVILNACLIPSLGPSGAALASLVTQISTITIFPFMIKELRPNVKLMVDAIRLKDVL